MTTRHSRGRAAIQGFTLLELLVALMVFAVLSAMTYRGLANVIRVDRQTQSISERLGELEMAFLFIERDLAQAVERTVRDPLGTPIGSFIGGSTAQSLMEFTCFAGADGEVCRVGYVLRGTSLERYRWPVLDITQDTEIQGSELLGGVSAVQVRFLDEDWAESWPPPNGTRPLPRAVELLLKLEDGQEFRRLFLLPNA